MPIGRDYFKHEISKKYQESGLIILDLAYHNHIMPDAKFNDSLI